MSEIITTQDKQVVEIFNTSKRTMNELDLFSDHYSPTLNGESYLTDKELSERLKISRRTIQEWRDSGKIDFIKLNGKIIYAESAIQSFLSKHYQRAWQL